MTKQPFKAEVIARKHDLAAQVLTAFPGRADQLWSYDVHGIDWDDNEVQLRVTFVREHTADHYLEHNLVPVLDTYKVRVACEFTGLTISDGHDDARLCTTLLNAGGSHG